MGVANLDPRGMTGRIYVGDHLTLLHTRYLNSGPYGFREDIWSFSHYKSMGAIYGHGGHLDLRIVTIYTNFQSSFNTKLHMKFEEIWPRAFRGGRSKVWTDEQTDRQTNGVITFGSGELKWAKGTF